MSIEDYTPDIESSEWWWQSTEAIKEVSEKFKESIKKWSAWIKRTQKDEKKAKQYDMLLANFLVQIIINPKYDFILTELFTLLNRWYPSNFLLWVISLIYIEVSHKIKEISIKPQIEFSYKSPKNIEFDDSELHPQVKDRINLWVEDIVDSVSAEYSSVQITKLINLLKVDEEIVKFISLTFKFFLKECNIEISNSKSSNIASFILSEVYKSLEKLKLENI